MWHFFLLQMNRAMFQGRSSMSGEALKCPSINCYFARFLRQVEHPPLAGSNFNPRNTLCIPPVNPIEADR